MNLKSLIGKLNDTTRLAATRAANICVGLGQHEVEVEHLFLALLEQERCDVVLIARACGVEIAALEADLHREISQFKTGSTRTPVFSRHLPLLLEHAWLIASLATWPGQIRSAHLLVALLTEPELEQLALRASPQFARIPIDEVKHQLEKYTRESQEEIVAPEAPVAITRSPALDQYTTSLTQQAREGRLDPVIGREVEIRQLIDILLRRRQNNPILTGEAGVGKTAVVEGLALRVVTGDVPAVLKDIAIHTLDMGLLQAGASVKGEFEQRLKNVIEEVKQSPQPIILFIDEAHTIIGAGGAAGQNDAANLLKPALARGELRTIAATTWSEYKKYFEKDAALARRFQVVKVEEPSEDIACAMLRAMVPLMEQHFGVRIRDEAVIEAVRLSQRYITGRNLPDKAVSVLDTACARVALAQSGTPALLEDAARQMDRIAAEIAAVQRETDQVHQHQRLQHLQATHAALEEEHVLHTARWQREQSIVATIIRQRAQGSDTAASRALKDELATLQDETPMVPLEVDGAIVAAIVSGWTGIPLGKMVKDEIRTVLTLQDALRSRILGQPHAIAAIVQRVRTARANLDDPDKPQGAFLFVGPSGVGKTETARALADLLYGGERKIITINMSEYQEAHSVSGLKGSPPGYVGYGQGGVLTEAVRRQPYSVVLLDEIEKAHPDVLEIFYQVLDKGKLDDAEGREIDFRSTIIIATANAGSAIIMQACLNNDTPPLPEELETLLRPQLTRHFKPAFLGRMKVVPYYPIPDDVLKEIIALKLARIGQRIRAQHHAEFSYDAALLEAVLARCTEVDSGARNVDHILNGTLLPEIAQAVLERMALEEGIAYIKAGVTGEGQFTYTIE
ncbi:MULTISPECIES: type VI secretion system ATPase TssH [unclassified Duganella]|uniref:type VI secretion system ATPase TssH n=1 Tax=unclassified Duganella TaxID=2636909 RepID=UPI00088F7F9B|nr:MULTISPECIES: type VI secretion system ATPase TssH [unclassified Duganella]SDF46204.1 type VI secretion system protein VasG [Duganella sp. OV458]SDI80613.1 type VI secretion system protein VasG [Duganella sp. OV510]